MYTKDEAYQKIEELTIRFGEQIVSYKSSNYNETLVCRDFIDPFFKALGWDVDNSQGYAEAYREVIHEDKVKVGSATKAPDYSFRLPSGKRLFFVEAKKPSVAVKTDIVPAYQVRRYAWSAKLPSRSLPILKSSLCTTATKSPSPKTRLPLRASNTLLIKTTSPSSTFSGIPFPKSAFSKAVSTNTLQAIAPNVALPL